MRQTRSTSLRGAVVIGALLTVGAAADPSATPRSAENARADEIVISNFTFKPSTVRSTSAGTFIGPGDGAVPGAGCGNAVDIAV